jgi:type IV pilus assembly protein PilC
MPIEPIPAPARSAAPTNLNVESGASSSDPAGKTLAQPAATTNAKTQQKDLAVAAPQAEEAPIRVTGFKRFLVGINNMGMGKEKAQFIENLAILLNSGLSVIDALRTVAMELRNRAMKKVSQRMIDEVESGIALWRAMDNQCLFSAYALALIRIGEESGSLSKNMEYLAIQQEKDRSLRSKVKMAMIYPSIVIVLTMIVTLGLAWFVLPQLVGVLISLNAKLPLPTRIIIWIANFFGAHGAVVVPSMFGALIVFALLAKYTALKGPVQQAIFMTPGIGTMARSATIASFGVILGSLLRAGVPIVVAVQSLADVTDTVRYRIFYGRLARELEVGQSFSSAFKAIPETSGVLPPSVQQLLITGERSGRMADMLLRIADIYEKKAEEAAAKLPVVLEPILLVFIGGLVGTIAFAIIVPIYSVVGSMGNA